MWASSKLLCFLMFCVWELVVCVVLFAFLRIMLLTLKLFFFFFFYGSYRIARSNWASNKSPQKINLFLNTVIEMWHPFKWNVHIVQELVYTVYYVQIFREDESSEKSSKEWGKGSDYEFKIHKNFYLQQNQWINNTIAILPSFMVRTISKVWSASAL